MFGGLYQGGLCSLKLDAHFNFFGFENGASGGYRFSPDTEGCAGCGQEPPPLIGAALLPCAGKFSVLVIEAWKLFLLYSLIHDIGKCAIHVR